jgi:putative ABC transport system permease protein
MFTDIFAQAIEAMRHNGRRTLITIVGMAWGIATVVLLLAYGAGFGRAFETIFAQFGTNMIGVFPGRTSEQAGGSKAGVQVRLQLEDVEHIQETVPGILHATPVVWKTVTVSNDLHSFSWEVNGIKPELAEIQNMEVAEGRGISAADVQQRAHVALIGSEAKTKLFSGAFPLGQTIRINGTSFEIVGVLKPKMQEGDDNLNRIVYIPFATMTDIKDIKYIDGIWMSYHGDHTMVQQALRNDIASTHGFRPTDRNAIFVADIMQQLAQFRIISLGLQVLLLFIGALTLGIAGIGLMNIMLVSVQQRTREIGPQAPHPPAVPLRSHGHYRHRRRRRHRSCLCRSQGRRQNHLLQRPRLQRRSRRYPPARLTHHRPRRHHHPGHRRNHQRHDPRHPGLQPRPHRSPPLRLIEASATASPCELANDGAVTGAVTGCQWLRASPLSLDFAVILRSIATKNPEGLNARLSCSPFQPQKLTRRRTDSEPLSSPYSASDTA